MINLFVDLFNLLYLDFGSHRQGLVGSTIALTKWLLPTHHLENKFVHVNYSFRGGKLGKAFTIWSIYLLTSSISFILISDHIDGVQSKVLYTNRTTTLPTHNVEIRLTLKDLQLITPLLYLGFGSHKLSSIGWFTTLTK